MPAIGKPQRSEDVCHECLQWAGSDGHRCLPGARAPQRRVSALSPERTLPKVRAHCVGKATERAAGPLLTARAPRMPLQWTSVRAAI